jgi:large subunit ribosomal protein L25
MEQVTIEVENREAVGSAENRRMRKTGRIPSVVYSHGEASVAVSVPEKEFLRAAKASKSSQIFTLKSKNSKLDGKSAVVKEVQKDYLKGLVLHIDFQAIREDEELTVRIPLRMVGEAPGVKLDGGILTVVSHELAIRCLPKLIPSDIAVDVSELRMGDSIHAEKLTLPQGVRLAGNPGETIVSVVAIRNIVEEETAAATPGAAEAGAAAPAEGAAAAAPAAGAAAADAEAGKPAAGAKDAKKEKK